MVDADAIREARAEVDAALKNRAAAAKALKQAERAADKAQDRLDSLIYQKRVAELRKADLAGKNGVLFKLTSTPQTLFEKQQTAKFVLTSGEWLLGSKSSGSGSRFRARRVGSLGSFGLIIDVYPRTASLILHEQHNQERILWHLNHDELVALLTAARDYNDEHRRGISLNAYVALDNVKEAA